MANYNQAPVLLAQGQKQRDSKNWGKAIRTHELEMCIMCGLGDRDFAAMKVMLFLTGNAADGSFGVAEKTILERCNISEAAYKNARKKLISMGWITHVAGKSITVNYDKIYAVMGNTDNTPSKEDKKIKGDTDNTPLRDTDNTPSGYSENTHNNITNSITKYDNNGKIEEPAAPSIFLTEPQKAVEPKAEVKKEPDGTIANPYLVSREWLIERHNSLYALKNGIFQYSTKFYKLKEEV